MKLRIIWALAFMTSLAACRLPLMGQEPTPKEDTDTAKMIKWRRFNRLDKAITALAYSSDGRILAAASLDGTVQIWNGDGTNTGKSVVTSSQEVYAIAISPNGKLLATAGSNSEIQIWDLNGRRELRKLRGHKGPVPALAFSPDGGGLASAGYDKTIRIWDTKSWGEKLKITEGLHRVTALAFSPDGKLLASGGLTVAEYNGVRYGRADCVAIWNSADGKLVEKLDERGARITFTPDGQALLMGGEILSLASENRAGAELKCHTCIALRDLGLAKTLMNTTGRGIGSLVVVSPDGLMFATGWGLFVIGMHGEGNSILDDEKTGYGVRLWEASAGKEAIKLQDEYGQTKDYETALVFSPDSRRLAVGTIEGKLRVFNLTPGAGVPLLPQAKLSATDGDSMWLALGSTDPAVGYCAMCELLSRPDETAALFGKRLKPASLKSSVATVELIKNLSDSRFAVRNKASQELRQLGYLAAPALRTALATEVNAEVRKRATAVLAEIVADPPSEEYLRERRAVAVLERLATAEAKNILRNLADGEGKAPITIDAKSSLKRMGECECRRIFCNATCFAANICNNLE